MQLLLLLSISRIICFGMAYRVDFVARLLSSTWHRGKVLLIINAVRVHRKRRIRYGINGNVEPARCRRRPRRAIFKFFKPKIYVEKPPGFRSQSSVIKQAKIGAGSSFRVLFKAVGYGHMCPRTIHSRPQHR